MLMMLRSQTQFIYVSFFQLLDMVLLGTNITWNNLGFLKLGYA